MVFGIDPIYIMLVAILAMAVGLGVFGWILLDTRNVLMQIRDKLPDKPPAPERQGLTAQEIISQLAHVNPIKEPLRARHLAKLLDEEMLRMQRMAGETTVAVPVDAINNAIATKQGVSMP